MRWSEFLFNNGYTGSKKEAQRLIADRAFEMEDNVVTDDLIPESLATSAYSVVGIRLGKHRFGPGLFEAGKIELGNRGPLQHTSLKSVGNGGWRLM